jgi:hypothetical protein
MKRLGFIQKAKAAQEFQKSVLPALGGQGSALNTHTRNFRKTGPYFAEDMPNESKPQGSPSMKKEGKK